MVKGSKRRSLAKEVQARLYTYAWNIFNFYCKLVIIFFDIKKLAGKKLFQNLKNINWRRDNKDWEGRCMIGGGRISKARINVILTSNYIKNKLNIPLEPDEDLEEQKFNERT